MADRAEPAALTEDAAPAPPADAAQYNQAVADALAAHQGAIQPVGELIIRMEESASLVSDSAWQAEMESALRGLDEAGTALTDFAPPLDSIPTPAVYSLRRAQKLLQEIGRETRALAAEWQHAVAAGDAAAVQSPRSRLHRIATTRHKALRQMERARATGPVGSA